MQSFKEFTSSRKNLNRNFQIRNRISLYSLTILSYYFFQALNEVFPKPHSLMISVTLALSAYIFITKLRYALSSKKNNETLHSYIRDAIKKARLHNDYSTLNDLLDSKYTSHVILLMSQFPESSFDYSQLSKWEKLQESMKYFCDNKFTTDTLNDSTEMLNYMKTVVPHFFTKEQ